MINLNFICLFLVALCVPNTWSSPLRFQRDASACSGNDLLNYDDARAYVYDYKTNSTLWINDVSDEIKSVMELNAQVVLQRVGPCYYNLKLQNVNLIGDSANDAENAASELAKNSVFFSLNRNGAIMSNSIKFSVGKEDVWSRNIKRAIISAFQLRSDKELRGDNPLDVNADKKSSIVYETDSLGKCRTTYNFEREDADNIRIQKQKAVHRCSLDEAISSPLQSVPYKSIAEYFPGRLFIDSHGCEARISKGILSSVECSHKSTYRFGSHGDNGLQAVARQYLKFNSEQAASAVPPTDRAASLSIVHQYQELDPHVNDFDGKYIEKLCKEVPVSGLKSDSAQNFRSLVRYYQLKSKNELLASVGRTDGYCKLAFQASVAAMLYSETDASVEALLVLMDKDQLKQVRYISEYPVLTALARHRNPSKDLVDKFNAYLAAKDASFPYLKKLYLVYSTLVNRYCDVNSCDASDLNKWSAFLSSNLGSNCLDSNNKDLVVSSLKAIGNIGSFSNKNVLENCAKEKSNSLEVRVSAIEAFRRFPCEEKQDLNGNYDILKDSDDDSEVRIKAFRSLVQCLNGQKFQNFAANEFAGFLANENDLQVVSYIIDFGKEHGVTSLINPALANPLVKEKLQTNFKEYSWNNFKYEYSVKHDGALEIDSSFVYTPKSFIPRSINFNLTGHLLGVSINSIDATLRLEGLDEILKAALVDKLTSEDLVKRLMEKPEQLLPILQALADKLKYSGEKPYISLAIRVYGSEVFFSQLDSAQELQQLASYIRNLRSSLYSQKEYIRNYFFMDRELRKPLANGFEFGAHTDVAFNYYHSRDGSKSDTDGKVDFKLKLSNSASFSLSKVFKIQLNSNNKVSLKKDVVGHGRFNFDAYGSRVKGQSLEYNLNLSPEKEVSLFSLEGKFFKLGAKSQYVQVDNFKVQQVELNRCTSQKFQDNIGVDLCWSKKRPEFRKLADLVKNIRDNQFVDEDNDDIYDADGDLDRPKFTLAGPYKYEFSLKNTKGIKTIKLSGKMNSRSEENTNFDASISSVDSQNAKRQLDISYKRHRVYTSRSYSRGIEIHVRDINKDLRLHFLAKLDYKRRELLSVNLELCNKILKDIEYKLNFKRTQNPENIAANYDLEALSPYHQLLWKFVAAQKQIDSEFSLDKLASGQAERMAQAVLNLVPKPNSDMDYDVNFEASSIAGRKYKLSGNFAPQLLKSNIDLTGEYSSKNVQSAKVQFKSGHEYKSIGNSVLFVDASAPFIGVGHGGRLEFELSPKSRVHLHLELSSPKTKAANAPYTVFYTRVNDNGDDIKDMKFGFKNFQIDLSQRSSNLAKVLVRADGDSILRSLNVAYNRQKAENPKRGDVRIEVNKNDVNVASLSLFASGNLDGLRKGDFKELPEQQLNFGFAASILEYKAGLSSALSIANSASQGKREYSVSIKPENVIKTLFKLNDFNLRGKVNAGKVDLSVKINREGAQYKSLDLSATSAVARSSADGGKEFDLQYSKVFNDGAEKKATGVVKYKADDWKNFRASVDISNVFNFDLSVQNERADGEQVGKHRAKLNYAYLDNQEPEERNFEISFEKKKLATLDNYISFLSGRLGAPGKLNLPAAELKYSLEFNANDVFVNRPEGTRFLSHRDSLKYNSNRLNVNIDSQHALKIDPVNKKLSVDVNTDLKMPGFISGASQVFLKRKINGEASLDFKTIQYNHQFESNSKVLGRLFSFLNLKFKRQAGETDKNVLNGQLDAEYKLTRDSDGQLRSVSMNVVADRCDEGERCVVSKTSVKRHDGTDCISSAKVLMAGKIFHLTDNSNHLASIDLKCNGKQITLSKLSYQRQKDASNGGFKRAFELSVKSETDIKKLRLAYGPFNRENINAEVDVYLSSKRFVEYVISGSRQVDPASGKSTLSVWTMKAKVGENSEKACELRLKRDDKDYSSSVQCKVNYDNVPYNYGYNVAVYNRDQIQFGNRQYDFDLLLPTGRQFRVEYKGSRATPFDNTDDDDDPNDEREFNATVNLYYDYLRDKQRAILISAKRDNYDNGKMKFFVQGQNPEGKFLRLDATNDRLFNETNLGVKLSYGINVNEVKNQLEASAKLSSDLVESKFQIELNLQKPQFNVFYSNDFNKLNGRLNVLNIRVAKLLNLKVDKEYDQNRRRISLELYDNPSVYKADVSSSYDDSADRYVVDSVLNKDGKRVSAIKSVFSNQLANINVNIESQSNNYQLDFGLLNEKSANGFIKRNNEVVGQAAVYFANVPVNGDVKLNDMVLELKWNRFWSQMQSDILGGGVDGAKASDKVNSYFGDKYAALASDLQPSFDALRKRGAEVRHDLIQSARMALQYYAQYLPLLHYFDNELDQVLKNQDKNDNESKKSPLYERVFNAYNRVAGRLDDLVVRLHSGRFWRLAKYVPRLSRSSYNSRNGGFENNLIVKKKAKNAQNIYQANMEYREKVRDFGANILKFKSGMLRNVGSLGVRALFNKYKFRSISKGFTIVGSVFNRRNIIGFDGESATLLSRCSYLLAHETAKNRFSVLLNFDDNKSPLSVYLYGQGPYNLDANSVSLGSQKLNVPYDLKLANGKQIQIDRTNDATCVTVESEIRVCCFEGSNSCSVALSRWFTGKVNGLLGKSDNIPERINSASWGLDCKFFTGLQKPASQESVRKCYSTFGKHRRSIFKDASLAVNPNGWRKVCESVLSVDASNYCPLVRAFAAHASLESVEAKIPKECYQCKNAANGKEYQVGQKIPSADAEENDLVAGADIVFFSFGCGKDSLVDYSKFANVVKSANKNHKYYLVKVEGNDVSVYQSANGELSDFDVAAAVKSVGDQSQPIPTEWAFKKGIFYAQSLFARRIASSRHLVFLSCGNCLKYKFGLVNRLARELKKSNIVVSSFGDYNIKLVDDDDDADSSQQVVGYNEEDIFFYKPSDNELESDSKKEFKFEHESDVCHRLAVRSHGAVYNLKSLKNAAVFKNVAESFKKFNDEHTVSLKSCEISRSKWGSYADFSFSNVYGTVDKDDDDDDIDN